MSVLIAMCLRVARFCGPLSASVAGAVLVHVDVRAPSGDVEHPVEAVFDAPVVAGVLVQALGRDGFGEEIVGGLCRRRASVDAFGFARAANGADGFQAGPAMDVLQPIHIVANDGASGLDAAMIGLDRRLAGARAPRGRRSNGRHRRTAWAGCVSGTARSGRPGRRSARRCLFRNSSASVITVHPLRLRSRRSCGTAVDLVRLLVRSDLRQNQAFLARPGADHVQAPTFRSLAVEGAAQRTSRRTATTAGRVSRKRTAIRSFGVRNSRRNGLVLRQNSAISVHVVPRKGTSTARSPTPHTSRADEHSPCAEISKLRKYP